MTPARKRACLEALAAFIPDSPPEGVSGRQTWHNAGEPTVAATRRAIVALGDLAAEIGVRPGEMGYDFPITEAKP